MNDRGTYKNQENNLSLSLSLSLSQKKLESSDLITLLIIIFFENDLLC